MDDKVSIVVPVYNVAKFLDELIMSLVRQTYKNIEIILVDDGSPDESGLICDKYASQDARIKVIHKKNEGVSSARNRGMAEASGSYITFIDGDDWVELDYIDYLLNLIVLAKAEIAFSDKNFTTVDRMQNEKDEFEIWSAEKTVAAFLYPGIPIGCWNKIYRTDFLRSNNIQFRMQKSGEGMHFIVTAAQRASKICVGHRKVYNYRLNNENSAITKPCLAMGLFAQKSINAIEKELILKTPMVVNAVNWHKWKNHGFIQYQILATNSLDENRSLFQECHKYMIINLPMVLLKSNVRIKEKIKMILQAFFPIVMCKRRMKATSCRLKRKAS